MQELYRGGPILTMEDKFPTAEALLVEDGRIKAVGGLAEVEAQAETAVRQINLEGRTLMPAFIDAHSHFSAVANGLLQAPLEEAVSFEEIQTRIAEFMREKQVKPGEWVLAKGYDHSRLKEKRHPDRRVLDNVCPSNPLVIQHQSGHMGVFNTMALEMLGVTLETQAPQGGVIGRENGELTGYMEENAFIQYLKKAPMPDGSALLAAYGKAQDKYARNGIATIQEGLMVAEMEPLYRQLMDNGLLKLDVVGYADLKAADNLKAAFPACVKQYSQRFKLGGYKIFLDGSPQGRTAWMMEPYQGGDPSYKGYPTMTDEQVEAAVRQAAAEHMQLLAHCNGDAACAQYIAAVERAARCGDIKGIRPVMIHGQLLRPEQLPAVERLGILPSFFVAHVYHWGDIHIQNFGLQRAASISPAGSAIKAGTVFTFHQDAPVIEPDMLETVWCAVCRQTKQGKELGGKERIPVWEALKAVTIRAAYQYFEENSKGSLQPGKWADLVMLDGNPFQVPPEKLREIRVVATFKEGKAIFSA